jgi:hypothetical protein
MHEAPPVMGFLCHHYQLAVGQTPLTYDLSHTSSLTSNNRMTCSAFSSSASSVLDCISILFFKHTLFKEEKDLLFSQPIVGIGCGVCSLSKVTYWLAKTMDFCQLFCGFEPTLGNLLNPLYHGLCQMAKWQRKNI